MANYRGGNCLRSCMLFYTVLFWVTGFVILFVGIWMITDPKRKYILDLVDFSEDDPLLRFAAYISIGAGIGTLFVGFLSCCGAIRAEKCMLATFIIFLFFIFLAEVTVGLLAVFYREKIRETHFADNVKKLMVDEYGIAMDDMRNLRITEAIDRLQFHMECCGSHSPRDWQKSLWRSSVSLDFLEPSIGETWIHHSKIPAPAQVNDSSPNVPFSCCTQMPGSTPQIMIARSLFRCQQTGKTSRLWRHQTGCYARLQQWFDEQAIIFAGIGLGFATFQIVGFFIALALFSRISDYRYIS